jgi:transposase
MTKTRDYHRRFSEDLRRELVRMIDTGKMRVCDVSKEYEVSTTSIYRWLEKYSRYYKHQTRMVVEKKSKGSKLKELEGQLKELESALGRKQMHIDYLEKLIEISGEELGVDIEKKGAHLYSNTSDRDRKKGAGR